MSTDSTHQTKDEFFVGYFPTPPALRTRLWMTIAVIGIIAIGLSALLAASMRSAGTGTWDTDHVTTITGLLHASPYVFVEVHDADGWVHTALLVEEGKHGADESLKKLDGQFVSVKGAMISRMSQSMMEVASDVSPQTVAKDEKFIPKPSTPWGGHTTSFKGEIFDPKCYLGAMKPGEGKTHKGCAALCLRGGIPPMFARFEGETLVTQFFVLTDPQGHALSGASLDRVIDLVGEAVELQGTVASEHGLLTLRIDPEKIVRRESK